MNINLYKGWSQKVDLPTLREWCRQRLILTGDWSFSYKDIHARDGEINAVVTFKDDADAAAFKLTFGL